MESLCTIAIAAREAGRDANAWWDTADINDLREEMPSIRSAPRNIVYDYAPLLSVGWRAIADYDKRVAGQACVGFLLGELKSDISLMG